MSGNLTDLLAELRKPFTPAAVKIKPQTVTRDKSKALVTFYIDSRLLVERLNTVVGAAEWSDDYRVLVEGPEAVRVGLPVECRLTVLGVTKTDVGQLPPGEMDEKAWKSAYSDAFKRAGVKFGVGAFLYNLPNVWAATNVQNDKVRGFSDAGVKTAMDAYRKWLASPQNIYGEPLDHGDVEREPVAPEERPADSTEVDRSRLDAAIADLAALGDERDFHAALEKAAVVDHGRPLSALGQAEIDGFAERLERLAADTRKSAGGGNNTGASSSPAPVPPAEGSAGEQPQPGTDGSPASEEAAGAPADDSLFKAPTAPRGSKRKAAA